LVFDRESRFDLVLEPMAIEQLQSIRNWGRAAERDAGRRDDGLTTDRGR
jgi:hypothetical protein